MRRLMLALIPLLALSSVVRSAEGEGLDTNAALKYWQAFALMPTLTEEQEKLLTDVPRAPLDGPVGKLIDESRNSLTYLRRAAKISACNWALDYEDGPGLLLPHLQRSRTLARLALLHARRDLEQGRGADAVDTALDVLSMARHVGSDRTLISILVRYATEANTFEVLAAHMAKIDAPARARLAAALDAPMGGTTIIQTLAMEKETLAGWLVREMKKADQRKAGAWRDILSGLLETPAASEKIKGMGSLAEAVRAVEELYPAYDEMARLAALPPAAFDPQYAAFEKKNRAANSFGAFLLPQLDKVVIAQRRNQVQRALFRAALDIAGNPDRAKSTKDPFGDGPFEYKATDTGFELRSKYRYRDQPVTLTVGLSK